jgi:hypothetical protein
MDAASRAVAICRVALSIALSLAMVCTLTACKPTDFFTEVVITPFSDVVDYNNPTKTIVNSPDASLESAMLTTLAWTDESLRSLNVENLVTWSKEPTSTLTAHHSIFGLAPRFAGIEASDAVRLVFASEAELDHESEANEQDEPSPEAAATSTGGSESEDSSDAAPSDDTTGTATGSSGDPGDEHDGDAPNPDAPGTGEGSSDDPGGPQDDPYGGYSGDVAVYNPGDGFARVNRVEHLAALGSDVAVLAQSLGGAGTICAMNEYAYLGLDSTGERTTAYASFVEVFGGEMPEGFEQSGLLWSASGSVPTNVRDIDALVAACGQGGVIVYDQTMGNANTLFSLEQRKRLQAAEIQLVPVDMSTVQGMLDAAQVIGDALSQSSECAQDAPAMAREYISTVNNIVRSVAATNGGYLGAYDASGGSLLTAYNSPPVRSLRYARTFGYIATDSEAGLTYTGSSYVDASGVVLFGNNNTWMSTPLSFWMQAAGVWDRSANPSTVNPMGLVTLFPLSDGTGWSTASLAGGRSGGALSRWLGTPHLSFAGQNAMLGEALSVSQTVGQGYGLGSSQIPYLIVCSSDGRSATQVKDAVVAGMTSYDRGGSLTPYSVLPYSGLTPYASVGDYSLTSTIGSTNGTTSQSPFYMGLAVDDVVRENPVGLLGSWTEGNMESVLEAVWLADIYSKSPAGCDYSPVTNMSSFSVSIGGVRCTTLRDVVLQFYQAFYRCDASGAYGLIVTDEGL